MSERRPELALEARPIARHLANLLVARAPAMAGEGRAARERQHALTEALDRLDVALQQGDTCVDVADLRDRLVATGVVAESDADAHADGPSASPLPLVLCGADLFLRRHFTKERRLARAFAERVLQPPLPLDARTLDALAALSPQDGEVDWQHTAVAAAVRGRCTLVTGGPGTGKTTTVRKLLQVLTAGRPGLRIALAAPTGKAASRLAEAVDAGGLPASVRTATLHRLLGYQALEDTFRHGKDRLLPYDLVVVDEASMVDLELMDALLQAMPRDARLCLLGDRDQLGSVGSGQVLADLCAIARPERGVGSGLAAFSGEHLGVDLPVQRGRASPLADVVVALTKNYRFASQPGIGAFATAVARGDSRAALAALTGGANGVVHDDLRLAPAPDVDTALLAVLPTLLATFDAGSPDRALDQLTAVRVLAATRRGPFGTETANERIETLLQAHGQRLDGTFYRGRPILVTANDHVGRLYNGDLGIAWPDAEGRPQVWFRGEGGAPRAVQPQQLPPHETAWAMTVHKSQGSEFEEVLVLLPEEPGPLLHAPLLYTAVTRARRRCVVVGTEAIVAQALDRRPERRGGFAPALSAELEKSQGGACA